MSWDLALSALRHDLSIVGGQFVRVNGSDEVRQRIETKLGHYIGEFFLNTPNGIPYYEEILGQKRDRGRVDAILRREIQEVPGVVRIERTDLTFNSVTRAYTFSAQVQVQPGPNEPVSSITIFVERGSE